MSNILSLIYHGNRITLKPKYEHRLVYCARKYKLNITGPNDRLSSSSRTWYDVAVITKRSNWERQIWYHKTARI
jgi:hypothetical protein